MRINIHAGHNPDGKTACGAVGIIRESTEARRVKDEVLEQLKQLGHTVYDCTVNDGTGQQDVLKKIVKKCNAHEADLDVSIHFNSGAKDTVGNKKTTGTEVLIYSNASRAYEQAERTCAVFEKLGFQNRGIKFRPDLYVLKYTKAPAMLVECCFVDDRDDVQIYNCQDVASAIVYGITGTCVVRAEEAGSDSERKLYRVQVGAYGVRNNAENMAEKLKKAGFDALIVGS